MSASADAIWAGTNSELLRALALTKRIVAEPSRVLPVIIDELAQKRGSLPALLSERECLTFSMLAERANRYGRWALVQELAKGETVCLLMPNRPEYIVTTSEFDSVKERLRRIMFARRTQDNASSKPTLRTKTEQKQKGQTRGTPTTDTTDDDRPTLKRRPDSPSSETFIRFETATKSSE